MVVVVRDEGLDGGNERGDTLERAALEPLRRELAEPPLDQIQPGAAGRDEVQVEARMAPEPALDRGMFVRRVVVHDQMKGEDRWRLRVDQPQEAEPLLVPMLGQAGADQLAGQDLKGREQGRRAVALVVVRHRAAPALRQREARLRPVEGLDLALLIRAQHQGVLGRIQVQPDHVGQLLHEAAVALEGGVRDSSDPDCDYSRTILEESGTGGCGPSR